MRRPTATRWLRPIGLACLVLAAWSAPPVPAGAADAAGAASVSGAREPGAATGDAPASAVDDAAALRRALARAQAPADVAADLSTDNRLFPGLPTAVALACAQASVRLPFVGDANGNSTTTVRRGAAASGPFATTVCTAVSGASPRLCLDSTVAASSTYYYEIDHSDPDGVLGTDPQVFGPLDTPACPVDGTTTGTPTAVVNSCSQITVSAPHTGDDDRDGAVLVESNTSNSWPGTTACASVPGPAPRQCLVSGLAAATTYYLRVTWSDPDGVAGTNPRVLAGTFTTPACAGNGAPPMVVFLSPAAGSIVGGTLRFKAQVFDPDGLAASNPVQFAVDGGGFSAVGVSKSASYDCNLESQTSCGVYEVAVDTAALANGPHQLALRATDAAATPSVAQLALGFTVNNSAGKPRGAGTLLRREAGAQLCIDCHALATHSAQATDFSNGSWAVDCLTCHTPHSTTNIYLVRPQIDTPTSGRRAVDFRNTAGVGTYSFATPQASGNGVNICEVCHTRTQNGDSTPRARNNAPTDWSKHYSGDCRACHDHAKGFKGGGESSGGNACSCHTNGMTVAEAARVNTYHHVIETNAVVNGGITTYPTAATPTVATGDLDKTCVQCHADHDIFRPDLNGANTLGRGANLRTRIATAPSAAVPGDGAGTGNYSNRDQDASFAAGGICLSCHVAAQTKNTNDQKTYSGDPGQTAAVVSAPAVFAGSAHAFAVAGTITNGSSTFSVACVKCHSDGATLYQSGSWRFRLHTSANRRLLNPLGITVPADPLEESFCFRCHSRTSDATPGGGPVKTNANRDYYNQVAMSNASERVFDQFTNAAAYPYDHPVQTTAGRHETVEGTAANDGTLAGARRHVQCEDCHNPHASSKAGDAGTASSTTATSLLDASKSGQWQAGEWLGYSVAITSGTGAGQSQRITASDTAGRITVAAWNTTAGAPGAGSSYRISRQGDNAVSGATREVRGVTVAPGAVYHVGSATFKDGTSTVYSGATGGIVTAASTGTASTSATRNWVANEWKNYTLRVVTGTNAGQTRTITANTQTQLTLSSNLTVAAGDLFTVYSNGATDTLYFKPTAEESPAEPMPNAHAGADTFAGGTWIGRAMAPGAPTVAYEEKSQATNAINNWRMVTITSPAAASAVNIPAGTWTLNLYCGESSAQQNAFVRYMAYKWNANDSLGTTVVARSNSGEIPVNTTPPGSPFTFTFNGAAVSLAAGDKLVVDLELYINSTGSYTARYWWGSGAASNVVLPAMVDFGRADARTPLWTSAMIGRAVRNELDRNGRWYRITNFSQPVAGQSQFQLTIAPSYASGAFGSAAPLVSSTKMTNNTTAPTAQWYMDYGTTYSVGGVTLAATPAATTEHQICLECHSSWAIDFGSTAAASGGPPDVPSGHQDGSTVPETNVALDFGTGQLSYHPVFAAGLNQPTGVSYSGWTSLAPFTRIDNTGSASSFGLSNTLTTGWFKESLLQCSDCHASDSLSDPLGPHASGKKWILKGLDTSVSWVRRNTTGTAWETVSNASVPSGVAAEAKNFCLNCHRWDVYGYVNLQGDAPAAVLSRVRHDVTGNNNTYKDTLLPRSGIVCNHCHGGDRIGGVHGSSRRQYPFRYDPSTDGSTTISAAPKSYSGKRLLNGAYWYGVTRATGTAAVACWGKAGTDTVSLCAHGHENTGGNTAQYSYDDAADP